MCYFHVNAILSVPMATSMIDRAGKVGGGSKNKRKYIYIYFFNQMHLLNPSTSKIHTLVHKDKNATIYSSVAPPPPKKKII